MRSTAPRSLRTAIQGSVLIAVLAGYGLLLALAGGLGAVERRQAHRQLVASLSMSLASSPRDSDQLLRYRALGIEASIAPAGAAASSFTGTGLLNNYSNSQALNFTVAGNQRWLSSRTLVPLSGGRMATLSVRQNVTYSIERQKTFLLLFLASAGLASLFTSALLRPVLRRQLVQPINALSHQLQIIGTPQWRDDPLLPESQQPRELQPIASAFSALQLRLADAWARERSFTDGVAHELRTPITLISCHAQSLHRQQLSPVALASVQAIAHEVHHMGDLVRHLLDLSRQDSGRLQLLMEPLDSEVLILEAFERLCPLSPTRLVLAPAAATEAPPPLLADRDRLMQCLSALVDNALAYSADQVELSVSRSKDPPQVVFHVADRGPGVLPEERLRIFERFWRGSAAATATDQRGSGLGLALVFLLMKAMGGSVAVQDRDGGGADFQLRLPITLTQADHPAG